MSATCSIVATFSSAIINPILALVFALGLLVFMFGLVEFLWGLSNEAGDKERGRQHMLWGVAGMFIMSSAYAILLVIARVVGGTIPC
jgi:predicted cobalt transporter CbtA